MNTVGELNCKAVVVRLLFFSTVGNLSPSLFQMIKVDAELDVLAHA